MLLGSMDAIFVITTTTVVSAAVRVSILVLYATRKGTLM